MLPYYGSDADEFSSAALPELLAKRNVATIVVSASGYLIDDALVTLNALIGEVVQELNIPAGNLVVGGISAGGTGAVRYSEYCSSGHCDSRSRPVAIFSVDAPLDWESWWNRQELDLRRANRKSALEESQGRLGRIWFDWGQRLCGGKNCRQEQNQNSRDLHDCLRRRSYGSTGWAGAWPSF